MPWDLTALVLEVIHVTRLGFVSPVFDEVLLAPRLFGHLLGSVPAVRDHVPATSQNVHRLVLRQRCPPEDGVAATSEHVGDAFEDEWHEALGPGLGCVVKVRAVLILWFAFRQ